MPDYKLSATLAGHDDDVRAVTFPSSKAVITGSRDGTVRLWKLLADNPPNYDATISSHATQFVNTVAYLPALDQFKEGLIISGGKDTVIEVREPSKAPDDNAERLLCGHAGNVCALDIDTAGKYIVSGSWDCEARVWPVGKWEGETVLRPHEGSVWGVLAYDSETVITASADKLIRVFHISGKLIRTIRGNEDVVRALCRVRNHPTGADFASAGNDGIIRLYTIGGKLLAQLPGHENFIYSLVSSPSGELISSSEDRTVRVWSGVECIQTITHPAISVWGVAVCQENGDIVTGASDRIARVFTRDPERFADAETVRQFEDAVKESSIPQQQMGDINKEKLPGPEFITQKSGTKDGQTQMIKELNGNITAYTWSSGDGKWDLVGTVVDAAGSGTKVQYNGQEYDYVFDVDIEDGKPPLKLPFNVNQNPYDAATKFIENNKLPMTYLEAVAGHIQANTQGATLGQASEEAPSGPGSDPWGSDQRYRPGGDSAPAPPRVQPKTLPQKDYLSIMVSSLPKLQKKVEEINQSFVANREKDTTLILSPSELSTLDTLRKSLEKKSTQPVPGGLDLVLKLATSWPYKDRMPGLDALRLMVTSPSTATFVHPRGGNIVDAVIAGATESEPVAENHVMMAVRAFANLFETEEGRALALAEFTKIQQLIKPCIRESTNRNLLVAAATVYINYSVLFHSDPSAVSVEQISDVLDSVTTILTTQSDSEVIFRALVATGTALMVDEDIKDLVKTGYDIEGAIGKASAKVSEPRIRNLVAEIKKGLQ